MSVVCVLTLDEIDLKGALQVHIECVAQVEACVADDDNVLFASMTRTPLLCNLTLAGMQSCQGQHVMPPVCSALYALAGKAGRGAACGAELGHAHTRPHR